jgi:hypothetical protein
MGGVVPAKIQTVEDMYRLVWTAVAGKRPIEHGIMGALGCFVRTGWVGTRRGNCECCVISMAGKARADCSRRVRLLTGAALRWKNSIK